jgi:protein-S-isoprenylcysteine O-methyltransferase Ste14
MDFWFFIFLLGNIAVVPVHFLSVEHLKLQEKYGTTKGIKIGETLGLISGWCFFLFWIGVWISPQPRFTVPIFLNLTTLIPFFGFSISLPNLLISIPFVMVGAWFGIKGVNQTSLKVAETHRTQTIISSGVYSIVRHPQYFGGLLAHVGFSFLLSASYSLFVTLLMTFLVYLLSKKEEEELIREFGNEYRDYKKKVPMLIPKLFN